MLWGEAQDHPRVGGEKFSSVMRQTSRRGSPPRGRGKGGIGIYKTFTHGITPAWAGKSIPVNDLFPSYEDHPAWAGGTGGNDGTRNHGITPRGRGKEIEANRDAIAHRMRQIFWLSSSRADHPRGRGKGCCSSGHTGQMRITPAWAGKSYIFRQCHISPTGSPRVGGEKPLSRKGA